MLRNIVEIDWAAHKVSVYSNKGAIILFDFKAAFPSVDHSFMWQALEASGLPISYIDAIRMIYRDNRHFIPTQDRLKPGPTMRAGVRQGCPLSGIVFAICIDSLLKRLNSFLGPHGMLRAYADDIAMVIMNYQCSIGALAQVFDQFSKVSGLKLNINKTVLIPLWPIQDFTHLRMLIR